MYALWSDIRLSIRSLAKAPGFTAIVLLCLALGIGANTAIYSIIRGVVIDPMPFKNGNDIIQVDTVGTTGNLMDIPFSVTPVNYEIFAAEQNMFDELGVAQFSTYALNLDSGTEALTGAAFSPEILRVFRINPLLGRFFVDEDFERSVVV
ncbi:MAG: ABC transporter permease, partial [Gammaproteobacteria bacterium]